MEAFSAIAVLATTIVLFLVFRAIFLWYRRINEGILLLKSIDGKLGRLSGFVPPGMTGADRPKRGLWLTYVASPEVNVSDALRSAFMASASESSVANLTARLWVTIWRVPAAFILAPPLPCVLYATAMSAIVSLN